MKQEDLVASDVLLSYPITAKNREGHNETLETVGDAASFLLTNFSRERSADIDWRVAASALEKAGRRDSPQAI